MLQKLSMCEGLYSRKQMSICCSISLLRKVGIKVMRFRVPVTLPQGDELIDSIITHLF